MSSGYRQVLVSAGIFRDEQHLAETCDAYDQYAQKTYHQLRFQALRGQTE